MTLDDTSTAPAAPPDRDEVMHAVRATGDNPNDQKCSEITAGEGNLDDPLA